jgi:hypothetical protein
VRISEHVPAQLRPFDEIKDQLLDMWREQSQRENDERYFVELLKKYQVAPDDGVKALVGAALDAQAAGRNGGAP